MRNKKKGQRKQPLNNRAAIQTIETIQVSHQKGLAKSTTMVQLESPKKINGQSKEFFHNNNLKRNLRSAMRNQSQGTMEEDPASTKEKYIPKIPEMRLDEYIDKNKQQPEVEESEDKRLEENGEEHGVERYINYESDKVEEINVNTTMVQFESPKKINGQSKEFCHNNNNKRNLRSTMRNQSQGTMEEEQAFKMKRYIPKLPAMPLDEYINMNKQQSEVEESEDKSIEQAFKMKRYIPKLPAMPLDEYINMNKQQSEVEESEDKSIEGNDEEQRVERDINYESDQVEEINVNISEGASSKRRRGRGKTLCAKIHIRSSYDREEITLNEEGQPIGPSDRIVSQFSSFLGTIARSSDLCPLIYTNWKAVPEKDKNIWGYVKEKYIVPEKGKKAVYAIINDAWRRYKCVIKKRHFNKYKNLHERLKNRPKDIPEEHFRKLTEYWRLDAIRDISLQNAQNTAHMKCRHRAGPISFARIRERMSASKEDRELPQAKMLIGTQKSKKGKELDQETSDAVCASREDSEPSQAEMFIGTRQSEKGKDLVPETSDAVCASWEDSEPSPADLFTGTRQSEKEKDLAHETIDAVLQNLMVSSGQSSSEALQNVLSKEKLGSVRCNGRTATAIPLKRSVEIVEIKRAHASEVKQLKREHASELKQLKRGHASEVKQLKDQVQGMEEKFQLLVKTMLNQNNSGLNMEALAALLSTPSNAISALRSSTPTHAPNNHELMASKETPPLNTEILGKAKWDMISTKMLLHICMDEIRRSGKPGIAFKNKKWEEIRAEFQKRANKNYTQKQLKNRLENLRVDWAEWKQLMGDQTSLGYNHQTGTIEADAACWDAKIRENAKYAKFQYQGLELCDELEFIFGEIVATNQTQWTPAIGVPTEYSGKNIASDVPHDIIESDGELGPVENTQSRKKRKTPQAMSVNHFNSDDEVGLVENTQSRKKTKTPQAMSANHFNSDDELGPAENTQSRKKAKTPQAMSAKSTKDKGKLVAPLVQAESQNEVGKNEIAATSHANVDYSIPDCVKVLKGAKEAGLLSGREFSYALEMLRDDQTRELLISLKDSVDALVEWILYKYVSEGHLH